jgi:hypothetical protein
VIAKVTIKLIVGDLEEEKRVKDRNNSSGREEIHRDKLRALPLNPKQR